jgi:6-phosphogluconolactonase
MYDPDCRQIPWRRTHLWIVDERCVPLNHEKSNFRMINEIIVEHADIPREQVHPIFAEGESADRDYESALRDSLSWREKGHDRLDFVLLGMGADGHTASLFPRSPAVREQERLVIFNRGGGVVPPDRVTMTYPLLNAARFIAVMVTGASKAEMVDRVARGDDSVEEIPIKGIRPLNGQLRWYLDADAARGRALTGR